MATTNRHSSALIAGYSHVHKPITHIFHINVIEHSYGYLTNSFNSTRNLFIIVHSLVILGPFY